MIQEEGRPGSRPGGDEIVAKQWYSYKLKREVLLLDEAEWQQVAPLLSAGIAWIQSYREQEGVSLADAKRAFPDRAAQKYAEITGECLRWPGEVASVRMAVYGPPCPSCRKPFRTPRAKICMECAYELTEGRAQDLGLLEDF